MKPIKEIYKYKELLGELVKRDIKVKYRRSLLGVIWSVLNPLLFMVVITIVFSTIFKSDIENFPIYFLCGQIVFAFFSEATSMAQTSILGNGALIKKVYIPKYIFPVSKVCSGIVNVGFSLIAIIIMMVILRYIPPVTALLFFVPLIYAFLYAIGVSMLISALAVFFRDTVHLYSILLTVLSYFSALFYPVEIIPAQYQGLINFNPIYVFINYFRQLVLVGKVPSLEYNVLCIAHCVLMLIVGYYTFKRSENKFILYI
ncbi:ABC transporter permease [Niameybacter massiliensis]|uniref:ABC transporter permease n=1 Tax=Niameybacter massiliensis TaxID=1658108 RepID=UPI0006B540ED|nr:ABC transporter permease [Niameybacter massiliensis]